MHRRFPRRARPPVLTPFAAAPDSEFLYGVAPVLAAMSQRWRAMDRLLLQESMVLSKRKDAAAVERVELLAREQSLPVLRVDKHTLNLCCANRPHQGVVLEAQPLGFAPLAAPPVVAADPPVWLALDEVTDPQNLGALLRSAYFLGADGVVVSAQKAPSALPSGSDQAPCAGERAELGAADARRVQGQRRRDGADAGARDAQHGPRAAEQGWRVLGAARSRECAS